MNHDYSKDDIESALRSVEIVAGDSIFVHSNIGFFGKLKGADTKENLYRIFKEAIFHVIGPEGTLVVPTFTYSFCKKQPFSIADTKSSMGILSEMVRQDPDSLRSGDANFSVAAIGKNAEYFTKNAPPHSFGRGSFWDKFLEREGKFCNFNFDSGSTFVHFVERELRAPYRYDKAFPGKVMDGGKESDAVFYHFVYDLEKPEDGPNFIKLDERAKELGLAKVSPLGKGTVLSISAKDVFDLIRTGLEKDSFFLRVGKSEKR